MSSRAQIHTPTSHVPSTLIHEISTHTAPINTLTFSSGSGAYILTGSSDRQIHLNRTEPVSKSENLTSSSTTTTTPIQRYTSHGYPVLAVAVPRDNQTFSSGSADRSGPFVWDINLSGSTIRRFGANSPSPHTARITCVDYAAEDRVLASGSDDRSVRMWDLKSRDARPVMVLGEARDGVSVVRCCGAEVVVGSVDGRVRAYDVRVGQVVVDVLPGPVGWIDLAREGGSMLVSCLDGKMRLMDRENGACLRTFPEIPSTSTSSNTSSGDVKELEKNRSMSAIGYQNRSLRLQSCLAQRGGLVLSGSEADGRVRGWDVLTGKEVGSVECGSTGKPVSVVKWREGSEAAERRGVWAGAGVDGVVRVYS